MSLRDNSWVETNFNIHARSVGTFDKDYSNAAASVPNGTQHNRMILSTNQLFLRNKIELTSKSYNSCYFTIRTKSTVALQ
ncbi:MAG: hypothetical protein KA160_03620 [Lacibacter sp.]|nr:hypothetical protein [Lacibacter sp.]